MEQPTSPSSPKVVDLASRSKKASKSSGSSLMEGMWGVAKGMVSSGLDKAFAEIDDDLFKRSEVRQEIFDGLRELRKRQPLIARLFLEQVEEDFRQAVQPAASSDPTPTNKSRGSGAGKPGLSSVPLSLVEDSELEKTLAVSRMVSTAESAHAREITALRARVAMLRGGSDPEQVPVPLSPESVATAFSEALDNAPDLQMSERIVAYKHFERNVMALLGQVYHEINEGLAGAGVLPDYKPQVRVRNPDGQIGPASVAASPSGAYPENQEPHPGHVGQVPQPSYPAPPPAYHGDYMSPGVPAQPATPVPGQVGEAMAGLPASFSHLQLSASEQAAWAELRQAIAHNRQPGSGGQGPAASMGDLGQAIAALRELQSLLGGLSESKASPRQVKAKLLEELGHGTPAAKSLGDHEDAIDTVALMFEHILSDPDLPSPMQALLARLQVPFVKVAVQEPHLFAKRDHPARRLLDLLGETGKGWDPAADRDSVLFNQIKQVVGAVHDEFLEDPAVFDRQYARLESFVKDLAERASLTQRRAQEVAQARERLERAQAVATQAVVDRTAGKTLPEWARTMLLRHWASYMVLIIQRQGEASEEFQKAQGFVDHVAAAPECKDPASKRALEARVPELLKQMEDGLATLGIPKADIQRMTDTLKAYLEMHSGSVPVAQISTPPLPPAPSHARTSTFRRGFKPSEASLEAVGKLQVNDWVELVNDQGRRTRGKVSWISSFTRRVLLVTLSGTKLDERSQEDLARMLETDRLRLLENKPLFDRAMGSIVGHIRGK